jgi:WD40 repeat protein
MVLLVLALQITLASPQPIADVDAGKMKGDIARLAWSPDGSDFYIQTVERDRAGAITGVKHYIVSTASKNVKGVDQEPPWAAKYWAWKSGQTAPGIAAFRIDVNQREEVLRATASPTGGALAKGGTADPTQGTTFDEVANAANQTQKMLVSTLKVRDETIGTWVNEPVMPGFTFSWAPTPLHLLAFARRDKKDGGPIVVIDPAGQKQELAGPKTAILPAWSDDGKRLAWLERKDKKKFQLMVADISTQ